MRLTARVVSEFAGGTIIGILAPTVFVNGINISVVGDPVESHGPLQHQGPVIATGSPNVFAHNSNVTRQGDLASCGHPVVGGSEDTFTN